MSGAGHMLHVSKTLKANRDLLKKRKLRNKNDFKRNFEDEKPIFKKLLLNNWKPLELKLRPIKRKN